MNSTCAYPIITLPLGTLLYSGGRVQNKEPICVDPYIYVGQMGVKSDGKILYTTNDFETAHGYAADPTRKGRGVVKQFRTTTNVSLLDITMDYTHYDYHELDKLLECCKTCDGYYLNWTPSSSDATTILEITFRNAPSCLEYVGCVKYEAGNQQIGSCLPLCSPEIQGGGTKKPRQTRQTKPRYKSSARSSVTRKGKPKPSNRMSR